MDSKNVTIFEKLAWIIRKVNDFEQGNEWLGKLVNYNHEDYKGSHQKLDEGGI